MLGAFHVRVSGKLVDDAHWPRRQAKHLVKLLALAPKHQLHRQQVIDAICPDLNAESGAANLHKIIHGAALESSSAAGFERALELYVGDLLGEDPYAEWCAEKREQLRTLRARAGAAG